MLQRLAFQFASVDRRLRLPVSQLGQPRLSAFESFEFELPMDVRVGDVCGAKPKFCMFSQIGLSDSSVV